MKLNLVQSNVVGGVEQNGPVRNEKEEKHFFLKSDEKVYKSNAREHKNRTYVGRKSLS